MKRTQTITFDGKNQAEYEWILAQLDNEAHRNSGWVIYKEPLVHRVTAVKTDEVETL